MLLSSAEEFFQLQAGLGRVCALQMAQATVITDMKAKVGKKHWAVGSTVLGGCVKAWKLGEEEQRLLLLHKDVVVAFSKCFASGYLLPLAPGTGDPWDWFARLHQPSCNAINCEHQAGCQKAMNHNGC